MSDHDEQEKQTCDWCTRELDVWSETGCCPDTDCEYDLDKWRRHNQ